MVLALSKGPKHPKKKLVKKRDFLFFLFLFLKSPFYFFMVGWQCVSTSPNCVNIARGGLRGNTVVRYDTYVFFKITAIHLCTSKIIHSKVQSIIKPIFSHSINPFYSVCEYTIITLFINTELYTFQYIATNNGLD